MEWKDLESRIYWKREWKWKSVEMEKSGIDVEKSCNSTVKREWNGNGN